ncbi:MAG TPA: DUF5134 domain-containing protein [Streptosporangiaceae bacterium]|nr:DUF5134 domain-containing protein [Streptosporangiaceae bacterium]
MTGPGWLTAVLAALMVIIAGCCLVRLAVWGPRGRLTDPQADAAHVLMGVAMAGMLEPGVIAIPDSLWRGVFAAGAAWFGWQAIRAPGRRSLGWSRCGDPVPHAVECGAMLYMLLPSRQASTGTGMTMPALAGPDMAVNPALTVVLAVFMLGYVLWTADQLTAGTRARARPATAGDGPGAADHDARQATTPLAPRVAGSYKIAMSIAMSYMLLTML